MAAKRVLVSCPLIREHIHEYDDRFAEQGVEYDVADVDQQLTEADLLDCIDGYHGILAGDDELTARVLREADDLEVVSKWGVGTDGIDHEAADAEGVEVYNTPGAFDDEIADLVMGYTVTLARELHQIDRAVRDGEWYTPRGVSLRGKTFGVVGVGNIGSTVARRAHAFGMDVLGHDVVPLDDDLRAETGIEPADRDELFERADVVSLNCSLNEATRGMVGPAQLEALGSGGHGYLVNAARGPLVDQDALVDALREGTIAGAALDVFETEPLPPDSPLTERDDVVLGSHNGQNTHEAVRRVNDRSVENLLEGLRTASVRPGADADV